LTQHAAIRSPKSNHNIGFQEDCKLFGRKVLRISKSPKIVILTLTPAAGQGDSSGLDLPPGQLQFGLEAARHQAGNAQVRPRRLLRAQPVGQLPVKAAWADGPASGQTKKRLPSNFRPNFCWKKWSKPGLPDVF
jgi:hypothetical protein